MFLQRNPTGATGGQQDQNTRVTGKYIHTRYMQEKMRQNNRYRYVRTYVRTFVRSYVRTAAATPNGVYVHEVPPPLSSAMVESWHTYLSMKLGGIKHLVQFRRVTSLCPFLTNSHFGGVQYMHAYLTLLEPQSRFGDKRLKFK